jgi:hypothetical protein
MDSDLETSLTPEQLIIKSAAAIDMKSQKKLNKKLHKMLNKEKKNTEFMDKVNRNVNQLESILCEIELNTKTLMKITPENSPKESPIPETEGVKEEVVLPDSQEESKTEEVKTEEVKTEEVKTEEVKPEEVKPEEVKPEEVKPEEVKPEEIKEDIVLPDSQEESKESPIPDTEEVKTEEVKTEEVKTEEVKTEEVKTEEVKTEEVKTEEVKTEEVKTEDDILKQIKNITEKLDDIIDSTNKTITEISNDKNTVKLVSEVKQTKCSNIKWNKLFVLVKDVVAKFIKVKNSKEKSEVKSQVNINV